MKTIPFLVHNHGNHSSSMSKNFLMGPMSNEQDSLTVLLRFVMMEPFAFGFLGNRTFDSSWMFLLLKILTNFIGEYC